MSLSKNIRLKHLNDCTCCQGATLRTPAPIVNRPGLKSIAYRVGTHASFRETLLARLSSTDWPALGSLTARHGEDFSLALLDAWAVVADVLSFYQERIAGEHYLGTATERFSVLELARLIGYDLRPGVAAGADLAFTLEEARGAYGQALSTAPITTRIPTLPPPVTLEPGIKIQSVPGPDERAQVFETVESIQARADYNAIRPRLNQPQHLGPASQSFFVRGTDTGLVAGDILLIIQADGQKKTHRIQKVLPDEKNKATRIDVADPPADLPAIERPTLTQGLIEDVPPSQPLNADLVKDLLDKRWPAEDLHALAALQNWRADDLTQHIRSQLAEDAAQGQGGVMALRLKAAIFGYSAPRWDSHPTSLRFPTKISIYQPNGSFVRIDNVQAAFPNNWETRTVEDDAAASGNLRHIYLDSTYTGIAENSWVVLRDPAVADELIVQVKAHTEVTRSDFSISGKMSRLTVQSGSLAAFKMRTTTVLAQSMEMDLAAMPIETPVGDDIIVLDDYYYGLNPGRRIILSGERVDLAGVYASEARTLKQVTVEKGYTIIVLDAPLDHTYVRTSVIINANVVRATHGESVTEILGSGDARQTFQTFLLRQPPVTHVCDSAASGVRSTLEVRINDLLWHEKPSFFGQGPDARIFVTETDDDGSTRIRFGDGRTGATPPTGQQNLTAAYRKGIGLQGLVKAHQLTQLMTRPLGVKEVTNPVAANGAADPEALDDARRNAPLAVLAMDRIVSLQDYEDFACAYAGIDKALATWTWIGRRRGVFLTVAGPLGAQITKTSDLYHNLLAAMQSAGDPTVTLTVEPHQPRFFQIVADIQRDSDHLSANVLTDMEQRLRSAFSFPARRFGQAVHHSEVLAVMQETPGVVAVDIKALHRTDLAVGFNTLLPSASPQASGPHVFAAELLILDPRPLQLEVLA